MEQVEPGIWLNLLTYVYRQANNNWGAATTYFDEHLSHNDYYTQTQTQAGQWIGVGCERLGLQPGEVVTRDAFLKLCDNLHPDTGAAVDADHHQRPPHLL